MSFFYAETCPRRSKYAAAQIEYSVLNYLSDGLRNKILKYKKAGISEIRLRVNQTAKVCAGGKTVDLGGKPLTASDIAEVVSCACKRSVYAYAEQIRRGFIGCDDGERIGLAGEFIYNNGRIEAIKNFTSLNIRFPNEIKGVAMPFYKACFKSGLKSVLIVSKAGDGKTTFARDLARLVSSGGVNVAVIDERGELSGENSLDLGLNTDVLRFADKNYGLTSAIRTLSPKAVVVDELITASDFYGVKTASLSGVKVIATVHSDSVKNAVKKPVFTSLNLFESFDYYIEINCDGFARAYTVFDNRFINVCSF